MAKTVRGESRGMSSVTGAILPLLYITCIFHAFIAMPDPHPRHFSGAGAAKKNCVLPLYFS
jgi:hypothetical protein